MMPSHQKQTQRSNLIHENVTVIDSSPSVPKHVKIADNKGRIYQLESKKMTKEVHCIVCVSESPLSVGIRIFQVSSPDGHTY